MGEMCAMWLSTRVIRRAGDPDWDDYFRYRGMPHLREVRSIDTWLNPCVEGHYFADSLDDAWEMVALHLKPPRAGEYHLLYVDALSGDLPQHPRLKLLGFDLADETRTSSLLNCCLWQGELAPIAQRTGENGLLGLEDATLAQALLPDAWPGDPHGLVSVWALYEILPER